MDLHLTVRLIIVVVALGMFWPLYWLVLTRVRGEFWPSI